MVKLAELTGWLTYHTFDSRRSSPGFPDLVLTNGQRVIFAELKTEKGKVRDEQVVWMAWLQGTGQVEVYLWRPSDWEKILRILNPANIS